MTSTLEPAGPEMRRLVELAVDRIVAHIESLPSQPSVDVEGAVELARSLSEPLPETPTPYAQLLDLLFERAVPKSFNTAGPGYLAYIPGGGLFHTAVADLIADAVNRYVGVWAAAPALVQLEANVGRWFCDVVGYPAGALGLLTSGGSLANFTAVVTARRERLPEDFLRGVLYASDQVHHSIQKAAMLAGFPPQNVHAVASDARFRLDLEALRSAIAADRAAGRTPFLVVGNAGTTNTGAVDELAALADLAGTEGLWLHVDAAYGGFFQLTERGRGAFAGIERADSITLDPHKGMFLPYGTGSLVVRDGARLREAHFVGAAYLQDFPPEDELPNFTEYSPELSRDFRGLRVWFPLVLHGVDAFREALDEKLDLARYLYEELSTIPELELPWEPELTVVPFRLRDGSDEADRRLLDLINASKRVVLSSTVVEERFTIRACILSHRTHRDRIDECAQIVRRAAADVTGR